MEKGKLLWKNGFFQQPANIGSLKQKLWISYLKIHKKVFNDLFTSYKKAQKEIDDIVKEAKEQKTDWENVIEIFNRRFYVPFTIGIKNKEDTILQNKAPSVYYYFEEKESEVDEDLLFQVLSQGERRALYLLHIIFEIESRKKQKTQTLFVIDDIADSFDYKNKYAIMEYLKEISDNDFFNQIILTHNYDFHRTISSRLDMSRKNKLNAAKSRDKIILEQEKYQNNPFAFWKDNLNNDSILIASIPFVRNLADYCGYKNDYDKLTCLLHIKDETNALLVSNIEDIFKRILVDKANLSLQNNNMKVIDLIYSTAQLLSSNTDECVDLENKIVLSIAIRLKAENYMIDNINDSSKIKAITKDQTFELIKIYRQMFSNEIENIKLFEQVNLMTPENIHINSFMYEPILDMSIFHLRDLYKRLEFLCNS